MKFSKKIILFLLFFFTAGFITTESKAQGAVSFQVFYDNLSPYGRWVHYAPYDYVWIPDAGPAFYPYATEGHWIYTDFGWTWVSDYPWGWAPFHYGRWLYDDFYGWIWAPDNIWGPAWVTWRRAPGYYGWAPIPPGTSLEMAFGPHYYFPSDRWIFVQEHYINSPHLDAYYAPRRENGGIIQRSTVVKNMTTDTRQHATIIAGPSRDEVQKIIGQPIKPVAVKESTQPGKAALNGNEIQMYHPIVRNESGTAPKKVTDAKEIKSITGRKPPVENQGKPAEPAQPHPIQPSNIEQKTQPRHTAPEKPADNIPMQAEPRQRHAQPSANHEQHQPEPRRTAPHEDRQKPK